MLQQSLRLYASPRWLTVCGCTSPEEANLRISLGPPKDNGRPPRLQRMRREPLGWIPACAGITAIVVNVGAFVILANGESSTGCAIGPVAEGMDYCLRGNDGYWRESRCFFMSDGAWPCLSRCERLAAEGAFAFLRAAVGN